MNPTVFVGSSSEGKPYADAIAAGLESIATVRKWHEVVFEIGGNTQNSLVREIRDSDFVVIILTADDQATSRGRDFFTPRDNLIFEAGIGFGAIDPNRTFLIPENVADFKIPSDLQGFTLAHGFRRTSSCNDDIGQALHQIAERIKSLGRKPKIEVIFGKDALANAAIELINAADRHVILFGRDLSWADRYVSTIETKTAADVSVDVLCEKPQKPGARANAKKLIEAGAKVHYCDTDPGIKLTMVDYHAEDVARFMISSKERCPMGVGTDFVYRCEIHDASGSRALWKSLSRLYESLRGKITRERNSAGSQRRRKP